MRAAELLRGLADVLSAIEDDKPAQAPVVVNVNNGGSSDTPTDSHGDDGDDSTKHVNPTMVPPLQQKIEMMKKLAGIPSRLDQKIDLVDDDEPFNG